MKSFWISLFVFILFMCSCKTQKYGSEVDFATKDKSITESVKYEALVDTTSVLKTLIDQSKLRIIETITITEYDTNTGMVEKTTKTEREITQDSDKTITEEEIKGVSEVQTDSTSIKSDVKIDYESEVEKESVGGQQSFGKWLAIALVIGILILYLRKKLTS